MKTFYKIDINGTLSQGSGTVIPNGFAEYTVGQEPQELIDARANELQAQSEVEQTDIASRLIAIASLESVTGLSIDTIKQALK